jgi:hypothetical protein
VDNSEIQKAWARLVSSVSLSYNDKIAIQIEGSNLRYWHKSANGEWVELDLKEELDARPRVGPG